MNETELSRHYFRFVYSADYLMKGRPVDEIYPLDWVLHYQCDRDDPGILVLWFK